MTCRTSARANDTATAATLADGELDLWADETVPGAYRLELAVPGIHCPGCISRIESALTEHENVTSARVNMSAKRVTIEWAGKRSLAGELAGVVTALGFEAHPFASAETREQADRGQARELLICLAVAGFAAANVMLLSVSVWSGATDATRDLFHWISAAIALPAIVFSGRPFFRSAWRAVRATRLNMDVPISIAVLLAGAMSLFETINHGEEAYFDAAVTLLFFLLIGRYLDHLMRTRARGAVAQLIGLAGRSAQLISQTGKVTRVPVNELSEGDLVRVDAGDRIPVDGMVKSGVSDIDRAMLTGESMPETARPGTFVHEGTLNLSTSLDVQVEACGSRTLLADIIRTMEAAEKSKAGYVRLADLAARLYAPLVHLAALLTFVAWFWIGGDWHNALFIAISVLIITCPCALGLAVPVVQVVASGELFRNGIMVKNGEALERLAEVDTAVFDKTGTLTLGVPRLVSPVVVDVDRLSVAAALAANSTHPLSRAITALAAERGVKPGEVTEFEEKPGSGLQGKINGLSIRLGNREWCGCESDDTESAEEDSRLELWFRIDKDEPTLFRFEDTPRHDTVSTLSALASRGMDVEILSGDRPAAVDHMARLLGIVQRRARVDPAAKAEHVKELTAQGCKVLMVGDGINDAPALATGHTSMAPSTAADVGRTTADFVFFGDSLEPVATAHAIARKAKSLVLQNFALAAVYNLIAVPVAVLGFASPLVAAIAMSASSLVVSLNALRLRLIVARNNRTTAASAPLAHATAEQTPDRRSAA